MTDDTIQSKLSVIQQSLKAPKGQKNNFGNYKYRSCEDILEAVKPLLNGCTLIIQDDIVQVGERYYIRATAKLSFDKEWIETSAFAREALVKKGMDEAQITGSASSYARKYALNGLFCIDDTKDPDATNNGSNKTESKTPITTIESSAPSKSLLENRVKSLMADAKTKGKEDQAKLIANKMLAGNFKVKKMADLSIIQLKEFVTEFSLEISQI